MNLFSAEKRHFQLPNAELIYYPQFYDPQKADASFEYLRNNMPWQQDDIKIFGKTYPQPRLTALFADNEKPYTYSNITMIPKQFTPELQQIKKNVD